MRLRALAIVLAVVAADYAIWSWSLGGGGGRDVFGLVSGLTLPPLLAALLIMLAANALRLLGRTASWRRQREGEGAIGATGARRAGPARSPAIMEADTGEAAAVPSGRAPSSTKIAA